jgi:hypothetical protein
VPNSVYHAAANTASLPAPTPADSTCVAVELFDTPAKIESLRSSWEGWTGHRDSDIDFFLELVRSSENVERPHVLALTQEGTPQTLLVGRIERVKFDLKIGYLRLPSLPVRALIFSYCGLRGDSSEASTKILVEAIMASLAGGEADVALLHQADVESPMYHLALTLPRSWCRDHTTRPDPHYFMTLADNFEEVLQKLSKQHRSQLRGIMRKFPNGFDGQVRIHCFRNPEELERGILQIEEIAKKTYQRGLGVGFKDVPGVRRRLIFAAQKGWLRAYVLYARETPCSFWVGTVSGSTFCSDYLAFDPAFSEHSPGTYLQVKAMEELCKEDVRTIDFGSGPARYKERFGDRKLMETNLYIFAPRARGLLLNGVKTFMWVIERVLRNLLERSNLLPRIKRFWRGHAVQSPPSEG